MANPSASFRPIQGGKIRGHLLTKTYAKAGGGLRGWCIAVCVDGKIVRPVKPRHLGQAAPFWSDEVEHEVTAVSSNADAPRLAISVWCLGPTASTANAS